MKAMAVDRTAPSSGSAGSPIVLSGVQCTGSEGSLSQCVTDSTISLCSHTRDAGVRCSKSLGQNIISFIHFNTSN